jgi:hypothetical protein
MAQSLRGRLIGSIRRECLNHVLVLGERHLRRVLVRYFAYDHQARTHLSLDIIRTPPTVAQSSRRSAVRSSRSPKSVVCITATSDARRSRTPAVLPATGPRYRVPFFLLTRSLYLPENLVPPGKADGQRTRTPLASYQSPEARPRQTTTDIHRASRTRFWRRTGIAENQEAACSAVSSGASLGPAVAASLPNYDACLTVKVVMGRRPTHAA